MGVPIYQQLPNSRIVATIGCSLASLLVLEVFTKPFQYGYGYGSGVFMQFCD